jgi:hypothetical protein
MARGEGVLITPNHASHADCFCVYEAADQFGCPVYIMIAWQNFMRDGWLKGLVMRQHGGFSVDREGTDRQAFREAVDVLESRNNPLVIFPEGDVYHINDRITPFREGAAAIAVLAARKRTRPVVCVPCAIRYQYIEDPTPDLLELMDQLERAIFWQPRPDLTLPQRIYHFAEGVLALKEIEYLGETRAGPLTQRKADLADFILSRIEARYGLNPAELTVPERVKALRQQAIAQMEKLPDPDPQRRPFEEDLADLFFVVQSFSYPGDYVQEEPSVERIAETLDKFEEDVLGLKTARIRAARRATVTFGEAIPVETSGSTKATAALLTRALEDGVQSLLDNSGPSVERARARPRAG